MSFVLDIEQITWGSQSWSSQNFLRALDDPRSYCWILENTSTDYPILGYGIQYQSDNVSHIANLCIHPNRRGHGLGGILLRHMIDHARRLGASVIELELNTSNIHAYMLYFNHGFRVFRFLPQYYMDYSDAYRMTLML